MGRPLAMPAPRSHSVAKAAYGGKRKRKGRFHRTENNALKEIMNPRYTCFPWKKNCIMNLSEQATLSTAISAVTTQSVFGTEWVYKLNSLYQSRVFPTGTPTPQPNGFGTAILIYKKYQVKACSIELEFFDPTDDGLRVGVFLQSNQGGAQALQALTVDSADSKQGCQTVGISNTGEQRIIKRFKVPIHLIEGISRLSMEVYQNQYSALINANPSIVPYVRIAVANTLSAVTQTVKCMVRLNFHTEFTQRITDTQLSITSG